MTLQGRTAMSSIIGILAAFLILQISILSYIQHSASLAFLALTLLSRDW